MKRSICLTAALLKDEALRYFINVSRGQVVNEDDLYEALVEKILPAQDSTSLRKNLCKGSPARQPAASHRAASHRQRRRRNERSHDEACAEILRLS
ncbi:NAD(P)-dependent oxidoreductase [Bacillus licheniformis]|nr:NAD(P)-dependent oxidoreductase [Bacillus licheniformis]